MHGGYQSELKAIMAMLGLPGGTVRRPRLPVTDPAALDEIRQVLERAGLLPVKPEDWPVPVRAAEGATTTGRAPRR